MRMLTKMYMRWYNPCVFIDVFKALERLEIGFPSHTAIRGGFFMPSFRQPLSIMGMSLFLVNRSNSVESVRTLHL